jgi:hypothetical protein
MTKRVVVAIILAAAISVSAQSEKAYDVGGSGSGIGGSASGDTTKYAGLLDPSRVKVNHAMSFMAGGSQMSNVKSQSLYSTMVQYQFNAPVVLSLNFDMPIHSTFNQYNNLNQDNLQSMDYFRNMPIDASISWFPTQNFMMRLSVIKMPESAGYYYNSMYRPGGFFRY